MDQFPITDKVVDVLGVRVTHVENVVLMSRGAVRPVDERFARTGAEA